MSCLIMTFVHYNYFNQIWVHNEVYNVPMAQTHKFCWFCNIEKRLKFEFIIAKVQNLKEKKKKKEEITFGFWD